MDNGANIQLEQRSLRIGKWGNLFMGLAGVLAAWLSYSQALLVDGLFSLVGFTAAIFASRVAETTRRNPDIYRPLGYAAEESIYTTFRALSLLGLLIFAFGSAMLNIIEYANGGTINDLRYGPIIIYFVVICIVCFGLAAMHHAAWKSTDRQSDVLRLESQAAFFDGIMTVAAGVGLSVMPFLEGGPFAWIAPIGDSLIVLLLCGVVVGRYLSDFMNGLGELAGVSVDQEKVTAAQQAVQPVFDEIGGRLVDLSIVRIGRWFQAQMYFAPAEPIAAADVDDATRECDGILSDVLGQTTSVILISEHGRVLVKSESALLETEK